MSNSKPIKSFSLILSYYASCVSLQQAEPEPEVPQEFMFEAQDTIVDAELLNFMSKQKSGGSGGRGLIFSNERGRYVSWTDLAKWETKRKSMWSFRLPTPSLPPPVSDMSSSPANVSSSSIFATPSVLTCLVLKLFQGTSMF